MHWINHRGIHTQGLCNDPEGSLSAFQYALDHGWGLEFDLQMTADHHFVVTHDHSIPNPRNPKQPIAISNISYEDVRKHDPDGHLIPDLIELLKCIEAADTRGLHALHWKGNKQSLDVLKAFQDIYPDIQEALKKCLIFDLKTHGAHFLKNMDATLTLAPSVAHNFDIQRFNQATHQTLFSIQQVEDTKELWDWVWLDEWDLNCNNQQNKKFIQEDTVQWARQHNFKIAAVSPELHATSSALLGGEQHPDGHPPILWQRIEEFQKLKIDALCSDYCCFYHRHHQNLPTLGE